MLSLHPLNSVLSAIVYLNMAAKFVVAVALFALCHANPVLINGVLYRDGRAYSIGQAYNSGSNGVSTAQANVIGNTAQAYGSSSDNGFFYPGHRTVAQAQTYGAHESPAYEADKAVAQAQSGPYYPVPAPATVITYAQNFAAPVPTVVAYGNPGAANVQSSATSNGDGAAASSAHTQGPSYGSYGLTSTSSNAKTYGSGFGSADSNAIADHGSTSTSAKVNGQGSASSAAQSNGIVGAVYPVNPVVLAEEVQPAIIDAKTPIFHTVYVPSVPAQRVVTSNANVNSGSAASSAKVTHGRTISWRFGTAYDTPASAHAQANTNAAYGTAKSAASTHGHGYANANADANNYGSAKSIADIHSGHGIAQSYANTNGAGSANANADINEAGLGAAKSAATANTQYGSAVSSANTNTGYGAARSTADVHHPYYHGSRASADAHTHGFGNAVSSARTQGLNAAYKVTDSRAYSSGSGSAHANAQAV